MSGGGAGEGGAGSAPRGTVPPAGHPSPIPPTLVAPAGSAPRRIVVLGPPGSGKSTLARRLGAARGLPVFHLDRFHWRPGWVPAPPAAFRAEVERLAALPEWVIEGNYLHTIAARLRAADAVIYLDVPAWLCVARIVRRTLRERGRVRADAAPGCVERLDPGFLRFAWTWNRLRRESTLGLVAGFAGRKAVLRNGKSAGSLPDPWPGSPIGPCPG